MHFATRVCQCYMYGLALVLYMLWNGHSSYCNILPSRGVSLDFHPKRYYLNKVETVEGWFVYLSEHGELGTIQINVDKTIYKIYIRTAGVQSMEVQDPPIFLSCNWISVVLSDSGSHLIVSNIWNVNCDGVLHYWLKCSETRIVCWLLLKVPIQWNRCVHTLLPVISSLFGT